MKFNDFQTEDRRLVLLRGLNVCAEYKANHFLLRRFAEGVGHVASLDRIQSDLAWLSEQGLVQLAQAEGVTVATLTARGHDVGAGRATVPGVARPQPEH